MVERSRRGKGKRKLLGSHQKCWLWGRHVVTETLRGGKWPPLELYLARTLPSAERDHTVQSAEALDVPVRIESAERLQQLCHSGEHQGYLARMPEFPYDDARELLDRRGERPLYLVLDGLQDPYNLGAIVRSAEVFGADGLFLRGDGQVGVTSLVARASAGAVNHVAIARVDDLAAHVGRMKDRGVRLVAALPSAGTRLFDCDLSRSAAIVIGNEGAGVSGELHRLCDEAVCIPHSGRIGSLNAAVAAGIVLYESARQRAHGTP